MKRNLNHAGIWRSIRATMEPMERRLMLSTYTVNTLSDAFNPGAGLLTLRQAVVNADAHAGPDTIDFAPSLFATAGLKTIALTQGQINFTDTTGTTTVTGPGAGKLAISGRGESRIFDVAAKTTVTLSGLTVTDGAALPGSDTDSRGGGIYNAGSLALSAVTVSDCGAGTLSPTLSDTTATTGQGLGGGIYSIGALNLQNCTITGNSATGTINEVGSDANYGGFAAGGGVYCTAAVTISSSTISNNSATGGVAAPQGQESNDANGGAGNGGGVFSSGTLTLTNSVVSSNSATGGAAGSEDTSTAGAAFGAGIFTTGSSTVTGSTISNNNATAGYAPDGNFPGGASLSFGGFAAGAGIYASAPLNVSGSTFLYNYANGGAAGQNYFDGFGGGASGGGIFAATALSVTNSTVTRNYANGGNVGGDDADESGGTARGAGIYAGGSTTVQFSTIQGNWANGGDANAWALGGDGDGGGIFLAQSTLHVIESTVSYNDAQGGASANDGGVGSLDGGAATAGIYAASGTVRLINSTVAGNIATGGAGSAVGTSTAAGAGGNAIGAIFSAQALQIYDSTLSINDAVGGTGGGASNTVTSGALGSAIGGISNPSKQGLLDNTIVSANKGNGAFSDIGQSVLSTSGYNLIGVGGGLTNGVNGNKVGVTNPDLSSLGNYGGPTETMYALTGSPARAAGSITLIPAGFTTDQRGFPRTVDGKVDIGSVEFSQIVITGDVYNDLNGNGSRQAGEPGLGDWKVYIDLTDVGYYVAGDPIATTNSLGNYTLTFAPITTNSTLIVREILQTNWTRTQPAGAWPKGYYAISPAVGTASDINFGNEMTG